MAGDVIHDVAVFADLFRQQAKAPEPPPPAVSTTNEPAAPTVQETRREGESTLAASRANDGTNSAMGTPSTGGTSAPAETATTPSLTDDQILYVLHAANLAEMDQARVAQKKAKNPRV